MKLRSVEFERQVSARVQRAVQGDRDLLGQYRATRRVLWGHRLGAVAYWGINAAGSVFMPFVFALFAIGMCAIVGCPNAPQGHSLEYSLAISACWSTGLALVCVGQFHEGIMCAHRLPALYHFPVADEQIARRYLIKAIAVSLLAIGFWGPVFGYQAWRLQLNPLQWLIALGLMALHWPVFFATLYVLLGYGTRGVSAPVLGGLGFAIVLATTFCSFGEPGNIGKFPDIVFAALPAGWINGAFARGLAQGDWRGWLYLVPSLALIAAGLRAARRLYEIEEFSFGLDGMRPVFRATSLLAKRSTVMERFLRQAAPSGGAVRRTTTAHVPGATDVPPADVVSTEARVRQREFLEPMDWRRAGFMERVVGSRLSKRDRVILESYRGIGPWWTPAGWWLILVAVVAAMLVRMLSNNQAREPITILSIVAVLLMWSLGSTMRHKGERAGHFGVQCALLPVGYFELSRAFFRGLFWSCLVLSPVAVAFAVCEWWFLQTPGVSAALRGLVGLAVFPMAAPLVIAVSYAHGLQDRRPAVYLFWLAIVSAMIITLFGVLQGSPYVGAIAVVFGLLFNVSIWLVYGQ